MEKELNIAAILKDKPKGTKLWSPISGNCKYEYLIHDSINVWFQGLGVIMLSKKGKWNPCGETIIFPSKQMQDWSKFAWKKGDILAKYSTCVCVFNEWNNDKYTSIKCKYIKYMDAGSYAEDKVYITDDLHLASQEEKDAYISSIEEHYGGKLNLETLQIEHPKQEFKDGDIVVLDGDSKSHYKTILLYQTNIDDEYEVYSFLNTGTSYLSLEATLMDDRKARLATDSEKQQLFDALAKEGKRWNSDTKSIEDLPEKYELKSFDKVLVRDFGDEEWKADFFSHNRFANASYYRFSCVGNKWRHCIPYNEETKHLLGTTDDWKGGE